MRWHHRLYVMWRGWFGSASLDRELDDELRFHFDREVQQHLDRGLTEAQARRAAAIAIGSFEPVREASRDGRSGASVRQFGRDLVYGARLLRRSPGFSLAAVAIIALGIGSATAIFSVIYGVALKPLPFREPERLVNIWTTSPKLGAGRFPVNGADHRDWLAANHVFEDIALYRNLANFNLTGQGEPERLLAGRMAANLLPLLGVAPALGRGFTERENEIGNDQVVLLSDALWRGRFGADPAIIGRVITLSGTPHTVVGVMGPAFQFPTRDFQVWVPLTINPAELTRQTRGNNALAIARLRPGVTVDAAQREMDAIAAAIDQAHPGSELTGVVVVQTREDLLSNVKTALDVLIGAVLCLLLLATLNLATLLSARAAARSRELSVRLALGATRTRVGLQAVAELVPLLAAGGAIGIALAVYLVAAFAPLAPPNLPRIENIDVSVEVLLASILLLSITGVVAALLPVALAWRSNTVDAIRNGTRSVAGSLRQSRTRDLLVITQIALAVPLLVGGALLTRSFAALQAQAPGFDSRGVLTAQVAVPRSKYRTDATVADLLNRMIDKVQSIPGATAVGMVNRLPLAGVNSLAVYEFDAPRALHPELAAVETRVASPDYFKAMNIPILEGRGFDNRDAAGSRPVGLVDERIARLMWPGESAVGKYFRVAPHLLKTPWYEIVGVVGHIRHDGLDIDAHAQIYWSDQQSPLDRMALVVRTDRNAASLSAAVVNAVHSIDPEQPLYDVRTMDDVVRRSLGQRWMNMALVSAFAVAALALCAIGMYGVIAFGVTRQQREFGIRLALGATRPAIATSVVSRGLALAGIGIATGLLFAVALTQSMSSILFGVGSSDLVSFATAIVSILSVALIASYLPARRAAAIEPAITLRAE